MVASLDIHWDSSIHLLDMVIAAREQLGSVIFREVMSLAWASWCHRKHHL